MGKIPIPFLGDSDSVFFVLSRIKSVKLTSKNKKVILYMKVQKNDI